MEVIIGGSEVNVLIFSRNMGIFLKENIGGGGMGVSQLVVSSNTFEFTILTCCVNFVYDSHFDMEIRYTSKPTPGYIA